MGREAREAPRAVGVGAGGVTLVCPLPPAPLDDQHDRLRGVPDGRPHLVPLVPHLWGLTVGYAVREALRVPYGTAPSTLRHPPRRSTGHR